VRRDRPPPEPVDRGQRALPAEVGHQPRQVNIVINRPWSQSY
jgi:hypothetical protein